MKRIITVILSLAMLITPVFAQDGARTFYIDNVYTGIDVINVDDIDMVPLGEVCQRLGYIISEEDGKVKITKGENCKNSLSEKETVEFTVGDAVIYYTLKSGSVGKDEAFPEKPLTVRVGEEIYIAPYTLYRVLGLKLQYTKDHKIGMLTRDYLEASRNTELRGTIYVKSFDGEVPRIEVDGEAVPFTADPFIDEAGRTQVPVRDFCDFMNMSLYWFEDPQRVSISSCPPKTEGEGGGCGGASYWFEIGDKRCRRNGTYYNIDTAAQLIDGRTYIPLKYLAEMLNYNIVFNPVSHSLVQIGHGYRTMISYLGLDKNTVLRELALDDSNISSSDGQNYVQDIAAKIGRRYLGVGFENDSLTSFFYAYGDDVQARSLMQEVKEYLVTLYGEPYVPEGVQGIDEIPSSFRDEEYGSYFNAWDMEDNTLTLQYSHAPEGFFVHIQIE